MAKSFSNSYISFELPDQWECQLKNKAWICRHRISKACKQRPGSAPCRRQIKKSREAIIILAAKETSPIDSTELYLKDLQEPRNIKTSAGSTSQSEVVHAKFVKINGLKWADSMHLSSELPLYYTRYLATIKGNVAVLVTFSSHKRYYTNYSNNFFKGIKALKVTASNLSKVDRAELGDKVLSHPIDIPSYLLADMSATGGPQSSGSGSSSLLFILAAALTLIGLLIWFKNKNEPLQTARRKTEILVHSQRVAETGIAYETSPTQCFWKKKQVPSDVRYLLLFPEALCHAPSHQ